jgi:hypothetical protein
MLAKLQGIMMHSMLYQLQCTGKLPAQVLMVHLWALLL